MVISLTENYLRTIEVDGVVSLLDCRRGLFTVHSKDNLDAESTCRTTHEHYHGTSQSAFKFRDIVRSSLEMKVIPCCV